MFKRRTKAEKYADWTEVKEDFNWISFWSWFAIAFMVARILGI